MRILVIVGYCLNVNSSANLCHLSYIKGLIENGYKIDLLTANAKNCIIDNSIDIPEVNNIFEYSTSFYELLNKKKKKNNTNLKNINIEDYNQNNKTSIISKLMPKLKKAVHKLYGKYDTDISWYLKAKTFKSDVEYDYVVSLSFPPTSHLLSNYLKKYKRVTAKHWLQIWEDPWTTDLFNLNNATEHKIRKEENKLLNEATDIVYVSPLTLKYQQQLFPKNSSKMRWVPLPTYYKSTNANTDFTQLHFGYFGDYNSKVRNIEPFYNIAKTNNLNFTICGSTDLSLSSTDNISVYPRLPLNELSKHEDKANVLVFLCNLKGGQIPGKIYQYSATNKFILFILDGTEEEKTILKDYFDKFNRYVFCENNEKSILDAVNYIKQNSDKTELFTPIDVFEAKQIIRQILEG